MRAITFNPKYNIYDRLFHVLPESEQGLVLDINYNVKSREVWYLISLGFNNGIWVREVELSLTKTFK